MRHPSLRRLTAAALLAGLLVGCKGDPEATATDATPPGPTSDPAAQAHANPQLDALLARLEAIERDNRILRQELGARDLAAVEARRLMQEQRNAARPDPGPASPGSANPGPVTVEGGSDSASASQGMSPAAALETLDDEALVEELLDRIAQSREEPHVRALRAAALSMLTRRHDLDFRYLDALDPATREQVVRFHQLVAITFEELAAGEADQLTRREMFAKVEEVFGDPPLQFEAIEMCRRVDGYGVFTPLPSHRFVTGRRNTLNGGTVHDAVLYMELENFVRRELADGTYEVKVSWELELYDRTGTVPVWRQPAAVITDVSRNRRRDFFLAQTIDLPPNLDGGGYLLKIRVVDQNSGARAERTLTDIEFVADRALVGG
ncbi:MAG: hypothetical protein ACIAXF_15100 [Phycisphaerales bacterium JB063]